MCIKIGGWVRAEYTYGPNGNISWGWANNNVDNRTTNNSTWRSRGYITADARNQTEYGTVRGYLAVGLSTNNVGFDGAALFRAATTTGAPGGSVLAPSGTSPRTSTWA
jgi:hypothetical protein